MSRANYFVVVRLRYIRQLADDEAEVKGDPRVPLAEVFGLKHQGAGGVDYASRKDQDGGGVDGREHALDDVLRPGPVYQPVEGS